METPELNKVKAVREQNKTISRFLDWLKSMGYKICVYRKSSQDYNSGEGYTETDLSYEQLLALYFEVDLRKLALEKDAIYEEFLNRDSLPPRGD